MRLERPIWRRFVPRFLDRAVAWVHAGGHAAVQESERRIDLFLTSDAHGKISEQALWSVLSLEQSRYVRLKEGPGAGLYSARVAPHAMAAVLDWCDRDSVHEGPTREIELDCLSCGACCRDANVLLDPSDLDRFREAGREDLTTTRYIKRSRDGKVRLRFAKDGRCQQLGHDNRCAIYAIRPFNCSVFPVGSEACLAAREATLGLRDDARAESISL